MEMDRESWDYNETLVKDVDWCKSNFRDEIQTLDELVSKSQKI
jgi:hypothetical protein